MGVGGGGPILTVVSASEMQAENTQACLNSGGKRPASVSFPIASAKLCMRAKPLSATCRKAQNFSKNPAQICMLPIGRPTARKAVVVQALQSGIWSTKHCTLSGVLQLQSLFASSFFRPDHGGFDEHLSRSIQLEQDASLTGK